MVFELGVRLRVFMQLQGSAHGGTVGEVVNYPRNQPFLVQAVGWIPIRLVQIVVSKGASVFQSCVMLVLSLKVLG